MAPRARGRSRVTARLVEALGDHRVERGHLAQRGVPGRHVVAGEARPRGVERAGLHQPGDGAPDLGVPRALLRPAANDSPAQLADLAAQSSTVRAWRFAEPEGDCRRRALRVLDPHLALLDAVNAPRGVAEEEHVPDEESMAKSSSTVPTLVVSVTSNTSKLLLGMAPPEVSAASRAPRRPRRRLFTAS